MVGDKEREKERKSERMKYLLRSILGVDVDLIYSVHLAEKITQNTMEWSKYMERRGGLVVVPVDIARLGKKTESGNS